jgi:valine dehydrogenase (NAD+)
VTSSTASDTAASTTTGAEPAGRAAAAHDVLRSEHEQVTFCHDAETGLRAVVALHSTALGPGLGGTRFYPYASTADAVTDVLHLSRGMSYKNAMAGLDHGGGKAVIIGDPARDKTPALLRAYGRFVQSLGGRYVTACDVGTYVADMDVVAQTCDFVTGRSESAGGAGDSSVLTSLGVFQGMRAAAQHRWGEPGLDGRRVGVCGVGKVGRLLAGLLLADGADVVVTDVCAEAVARLLDEHPEVTAVATSAELVAGPLDVYSPCALGGALTDEVVGELRAGIVCGAANNQLASPGVADLLSARGITYAPDFVVNSGGVIQVADELRGFSMDRARRRTERIFDTTADLLATADRRGISTAAAADRLAEERIRAVPADRRFWLGQT